MRSILLLLAITLSSITSNSQDFEFKAILDQEVSCKGNSDGSILSICKPEGEYKCTIVRSVFSQTNNSGIFNKLVPGVYTVTATNGKMTKKAKVKVTEPKALNIKFEVVNPTLRSTGSISLNITGGTCDLQPYLVTWINEQGVTMNDHNSNFLTYMEGLKPGKYTFVIEDDHGCFLTKVYDLKLKRK